ncbi:MAG: Diacylglycerol kinase, prokaryotic [Microgenomates bacterium 39_7]|nr:MAG: Diacylglycerol kinase, prokaryotic [Microgenomates bacterium 39_7]
MKIKTMKQDLTAFIRGFKYAYDGILVGIQERNMRVHILAAVVVMVSGLLVGLERYEWIVIAILIGAVWSAELFNTAIENLADILRDEDHLSYQATKNARDLAAGAVLVVSIAAAVVGLMIFVGKFI